MYNIYRIKYMTIKNTCPRHLVSTFHKDNVDFWGGILPCNAVEP